MKEEGAAKDLGCYTGGGGKEIVFCGSW